MRKITFILTVICTIAIKSYGQQPPRDSVLNYSLQDCINYAYEHQDSVMNAKLDVKSAEYKVKETIGSGLPQINGVASFQDYLKVPATVGPNFTEYAKTGVINPSAPLVQFPFGAVKYNNTYSLQASQLLFSGSELLFQKCIVKFQKQLSFFHLITFFYKYFFNLSASAISGRYISNIQRIDFTLQFYIMRKTRGNHRLKRDQFCFFFFNG